MSNTDDIDGPGNNSYLRYNEKTGLMTIVSWDLNLAFGGLGGMMGGAPGGAAGAAPGGRFGAPPSGAAPGIPNACGAQGFPSASGAKGSRAQVAQSRPVHQPAASSAPGAAAASAAAATSW